jgi:hypothetical protein
VRIDDRERLEALVYGRPRPGDDAVRAAAEDELRRLRVLDFVSPQISVAPPPDPRGSGPAPAELRKREPELRRDDVETPQVPPMPPRWEGMRIGLAVAGMLIGVAALVVAPPGRVEPSTVVFERPQTEEDRSYVDYGVDLRGTDIDPDSARLLFSRDDLRVFVFRGPDRVCLAVLSVGDGAGGCQGDTRFATHGIHVGGQIGEDGFVARWGPEGPLVLHYAGVLVSP